MIEKKICKGCGKPIGPRMGYKFDGGNYYHCDDQKDCSDPKREPIVDPGTVDVSDYDMKLSSFRFNQSELD